jgi:hypothetical protein
MCEQTFRFGEGFDGIGEAQETIFGNRLHAETFYEVGGGKTATFARPPACGQDVIATGGVVAERLCAPRAKKYGAKRAKLFEQWFSIFREAEVFGGKAVHEGASVLKGIGDKDGAINFGRKFGVAER